MCLVPLSEFFNLHCNFVQRRWGWVLFFRERLVQTLRDCGYSYQEMMISPTSVRNKTAQIWTWADINESEIFDHLCSLPKLRLESQILDCVTSCWPKFQQNPLTSRWAQRWDAQSAFTPQMETYRRLSASPWRDFTNFHYILESLENHLKYLWTSGL